MEVVRPRAMWYTHAVFDSRSSLFQLSRSFEGNTERSPNFQFMRSRNRCSGPKIERFPQKMGLSLVSFPFAFSERMSIDRCNSDRCLNPSCKSTKGLVKISLLLSRLSPDTCCLKFYSLNLRSEHRELGDKEIHGSGFKITPGLLRTRAF